MKVYYGIFWVIISYWNDVLMIFLFLGDSRWSRVNKSYEFYYGNKLKELYMFYLNEGVK